MSKSKTSSPLKPRIRKTLQDLLPESSEKVNRLFELTGNQAPPIITVTGKYNHGKSQLLNELIGAEKFEVADKRQTVALESFQTGEILWLDAPGLDADVHGKDDAAALRGTWHEADIRLFVHSAKEGELDANEQALIRELRDDQKKSKRQTLLVLTQIDQVADEADFDRVTQIIKKQAVDIPLFAVSSSRHRQGRLEKKKLFVEKSGIPALKSALLTAARSAQKIRQHQINAIGQQLDKELRALQATKKRKLSTLRKKHDTLLTQFNDELKTTLQKVAKKLRTA